MGGEIEKERENKQDGVGSYRDQKSVFVLLLGGGGVVVRENERERGRVHSTQQ